MENILEGLNDEQKQVVTSTEGPLLVVAGPGTGKTTTLVRRIAHIVEQGVEPARILAVTFTNRAAREMRERAELLMGKRAKGVFIGTFHLLGLRIMRGVQGDGFRICGTDEQADILSAIGGSRKAGEELRERIGKAKSLAREAEDELRPLYEAYHAILRQRGLYDMDDLIAVPLEIWESHEGQGGFASCFRYVMVDEYQDLNPAQYRLMRRCLGKGGNICAVGDSDQAIYGFRGADITNFLRFEEDFPEARRIVLSRNYRSCGTILSASSSLIGNNIRRIAKELTPVKGQGDKITTITEADERAEARAIVDEIERKMGGTSHYNLSRGAGGSDWGEEHGFGDFAVIFRTNAQSAALAEAFSDSGLPFRLVNDSSRAGLSRMAGHLRKMLENPESIQDVASLMDRLCEETEATSRDGALLFQIVSAYDNLSGMDAVASIADELALFASGDSFDPEADAISLLTFHSAKGLEFKTVFIAGVEEGLVPFRKAVAEEEVEEERRLFYVAMTRAKDELFLTSARSRFLYGGRSAVGPSRFLSEIGSDWLEERKTERKMVKERKKQMKLF